MPTFLLNFSEVASIISMIEKLILIYGRKGMSGKGQGSWFGAFFKKAFSSSENDELQRLKLEVEFLRQELQAIKCIGSNLGSKYSGASISNPYGIENRELDLVKQEIDILRNELQEDIAAIHRLEILTLSKRIKLLDDFGKSLPPTCPGRTRKSAKTKGFSFGIITNGSRPEKLLKLIDSIDAQRLHPDCYEIIVAGSVHGINGYDRIRRIPMEKAASEGRLGAMRNALAGSAKFNKFVSLDDDFLLHPKWAEAMDDVQGDFDIATGIILNPDLSRYCDWVNIIENYTFLRAYHETFDRCQYVTGGYGIYKDFIFEEHSWNEELGFYQGEDVSFSRRLFDAGYQLKFIPKAIVMHDDERYRQKGYGVIRLKSAEQLEDSEKIGLKMEKLCPRTLS